MKKPELIDTLPSRDPAEHAASTSARRGLRTGVKAGFGDDGYGCGTPLGDRYIVRQQTSD